MWIKYLIELFISIIMEEEPKPLETYSKDFVQSTYESFYRFNQYNCSQELYEMELISYCYIYKPSAVQFLKYLNRVLIWMTKKVPEFNKWVYLHELIRKIDMSVRITDKQNVVYNFGSLDPWRKLIESLI